MRCQWAKWKGGYEIKITFLEVETDTGISALTFFPTYHHPEEWSLMFFFLLLWLAWGLSHTSAWIKSCPVLQASCCLKRDHACGQTMHAWPWTLIAQAWRVNTVSSSACMYECKSNSFHAVPVFLPFLHNLLGIPICFSLKIINKNTQRLNKVWADFETPWWLARQPISYELIQTRPCDSALHTRFIPWCHSFIMNIAEHRTNMWAQLDRGATPLEH